MALGASHPSQVLELMVSNEKNVPTYRPALCGQGAGYDAHLRAGERLCNECREFRRGYMSEYRKIQRDVYERELAHRRARTRALSRLATIHSGEYAELLAEEKRAADE